MVQYNPPLDWLVGRQVSWRAGLPILSFSLIAFFLALDVCPLLSHSTHPSFSLLPLLLLLTLSCPSTRLVLLLHLLLLLLQPNPSHLSLPCTSTPRRLILRPHPIPHPHSPHMRHLLLQSSPVVLGDVGLDDEARYARAGDDEGAGALYLVISVRGARSERRFGFYRAEFFEVGL